MELNTTIDRQSYIPLYVQVKDSLKELIDGGGLAPGEQLPGEPELCRRYGPVPARHRHLVEFSRSARLTPPPERCPQPGPVGTVVE